MVYECRNNHATFSAAYCPTCDAIARAEAAERELGLMTAAYESQTLNMENASGVVAEYRAEVERLRDELDVTRDLLRSVPEHSAGWYADICDYLETLDNTR